MRCAHGLRSDRRADPARVLALISRCRPHLPRLDGGALWRRPDVLALRRHEPEVYLSRMQEAISLQDFATGMIKAPFMALVIRRHRGTQGLEVKGSAASLAQDTDSVVKSIFLVILLDGIFAMFFASIGM